MIDPFPLRWPAGWPREQHPQRSKFEASIAMAYRGVRHELQLLGAHQIVVTSNALLNRDGSIAGRQPAISDTGVATYFMLGNEQRVIPCDKWIRIEENLRAIEKMVGALRGLERWGAKQMVTRSFEGFAALPHGGGDWPDVLGVSADADVATIDAAYRRLAKAHHPDAGGDTERFHVIQQAYRVAKGL